MTDQEAQKPKSNNRDVAALILGVVVIALALANRRSVKIDWIVTTWRTPLIVLIAGCLLVGMAVGYLAARRRERRSKD